MAARCYFSSVLNKMLNAVINRECFDHFSGNHWHSQADLGGGGKWVMPPSNLAHSVLKVVGLRFHCINTCKLKVQ